MPNSPLEAYGANEGLIFFSPQAADYAVSPNGLLDNFSREDLNQLTSEQLRGAKEASKLLLDRIGEGTSFVHFAPTNQHIVLYTSEREKKDVALMPGGRPQVFFAHLPGYALDGTLAIVKLTFTWSSNWHGADGVYLLEMRQRQWNVLAREFAFFP